MGWNKKDLKDYLNRPGILHDKYPSELKLHNKIKVRLRSKNIFK